MSEAQDGEKNPLQGYFDWQVTTLMLAHDLREPIRQGDEEAAAQRRASVEAEVRQMVLDYLPDQYKSEPATPWPPELMMDLTRLTLTRAAEVAGIVDGSR